MTPNNIPAWYSTLINGAIIPDWIKDNKYFTDKKECKEVK